LLLEWAQVQAEWQSFLEQQARVARRAAKRVRDDVTSGATLLSESEVPITNDKAVIRQRAIARGMFRNVGGSA
jgi:hypothetical protein